MLITQTKVCFSNNEDERGMKMEIQLIDLLISLLLYIMVKTQDKRHLEEATRHNSTEIVSRSRRSKLCLSGNMSFG